MYTKKNNPYNFQIKCENKINLNKQKKKKEKKKVTPYRNLRSNIVLLNELNHTFTICNITTFI